MKRHGEAVKVFEELLMARHGEDAELFWAAPPKARCWRAIPERAAVLCERSLALAPHDQVALAILGTAWRMHGR